MFLSRIWSGAERQTMRLECLQIAHDANEAPLLPPDVINQSKDISCDGSVRSTKFRTDSLARSQYQKLRLEKSSMRRHRKFVFGSVFETIFPGFHEVDPRLGNVDLAVKLDSGLETIINIRMVSPEDGMGRTKLLASLLDLGKSMSGPGNARGIRVGDLGAMHALGFKSATSKEIYKGTEEMSVKLKTASTVMVDWMEDNMRDILQHMMEIDTSLKVASLLPCMPRGPGSRVMISVNLANSPHYDVGDSSKSVAVWFEEKPGQSRNWYFVLPNVSINGSKGAIVKLGHGVVIAWDAKSIFHCSSKTDTGNNNKVYGCMWGSSRS